MALYEVSHPNSQLLHSSLGSLDFSGMLAESYLALTHASESSGDTSAENSEVEHLISYPYETAPPASFGHASQNVTRGVAPLQRQTVGVPQLINVNGTPQIATQVQFVSVPQTQPQIHPNSTDASNLGSLNFPNITFPSDYADAALLLPNVYAPDPPLVINPNYASLSLNSSPTAPPPNPFPVRPTTSPTTSTAAADAGPNRKRKRSALTPSPPHPASSGGTVMADVSQTPAGGLDLLAQTATPAGFPPHSRLMVTGLPPKSRVETQMKMTLKLVNSQRVKHLILDDRLVAANQSRRRKEPNPEEEAMAAIEAHLKLSCKVISAQDPHHNEVFRCQNCIQRERKTLLRKQSKSGGSAASASAEDADEETERRQIVQFYTNKVIDFNDGEATIPIRITCYCRHYKETIGFGLVLSLTDGISGQVVASTLSPWIMITDDHKSHTRRASKRQKTNGSDSGEGLSPQASIVDVLMAEASPTSSSSSLSSSPQHYGSGEVSGVPLVTGDLATLLPPQSFFRPGSANTDPPPATGSAPVLPSAAAQPPQILISHTDGTTTADGLMLADNDYYNDSSSSSLGHSPVPDDDFLEAALSGAELSHDSAPSSPPSSTASPPHWTTHTTNGSPQVLAVGEVEKVVPAEGPMAGGIEVTVLGQNLTPSHICYFGAAQATIVQFWNPQTFIVVLPPSQTPTTVPVYVLLPAQLTENTPRSPLRTPSVAFTYRDEGDRHLLELALQLIGMKTHGRLEDAKKIALDIVSKQQGINVAPSAGHSSTPVEDVVLGVLQHKLVGGELTKEALDTASDASGQTLLHLAACKGYVQLTKFLLANQADPNAQDFNGNSPLHLAALAGAAMPIIQLLLSQGASPVLNNEQGDLPHDLAPVVSPLQAKLFQIASEFARKTSPSVEIYLQRNYLINAWSHRSLRSALRPPSPANVEESALIVEEPVDEEVSLSDSFNLPAAAKSHSASPYADHGDEIVSLDAEFLPRQKSWAAMSWQQRFASAWPLVWGLMTNLWANYRLSIYISLIVGMTALGAIEFLPYLFASGSASSGVPLTGVRNGLLTPSSTPFNIAQSMETLPWWKVYFAARVGLVGLVLMAIALYLKDRMNRIAYWSIQLIFLLLVLLAWLAIFTYL